MVESIAKTLGTGSGIDTAALVDQLVAAQYDTRKATLTAKGEALDAQISAASELRSTITAFNAGLKALVSGGTLATQPRSANTAVVKASLLSGASVTGLNTSVEVRQLASAQVTSSGPVASKTAAIGGGTLTLTFGTATVTDGAMGQFTAGTAAPVAIAIPAGSSLEGIASAINGAAAGVAASILTDADGSRLVLKAATGAGRAFTLATSDAALAGLAVGVGASGTTIGSPAQDAIVAIDGVAVRRDGNAISDLVAGVRLDLVSAAPGTRVAIGTDAPTAALQQAVQDVVDTFNTLYTSLKTAVSAVDGPLRGDAAAKSLLRALSTLTTTDLVPAATDGKPRTLAAVGVQTLRDGTLSLDSSALGSALVRDSSAVEAMFRQGSGLSAALNTITLAAASTTTGLGASESRYTQAKSTLSEDQQAALDAAEALRTRMTRQFANMDTVVARYKSTQTFLEQQIKAWNQDS